MSFFVLPFIGLMPVIAADNLGMDVKSLSYGLLYAAFGTGAALGAMSIGTFLAAATPSRGSCGVGCRVFAVAAGGVRAGAAAPRSRTVVVVLGFAYFAAVTSLSTVLQEHLDDAVRGRVMALWIMAFGGTVPLGTLAAGPLADPRRSPR